MKRVTARYNTTSVECCRGAAAVAAVAATVPAAAVAAAAGTGNGVGVAVVFPASLRCFRLRGMVAIEELDEALTCMRNGHE